MKIYFFSAKATGGFRPKYIKKDKSAPKENETADMEAENSKDKSKGAPKENETADMEAESSDSENKSSEVETNDQTLSLAEQMQQMKETEENEAKILALLTSKVESEDVFASEDNTNDVVEGEDDTKDVSESEDNTKDETKSKDNAEDESIVIRGKGLGRFMLHLLQVLYFCRNDTF